MAFDDRLQYLLLGMGIGFVLGYLVRLVQSIRNDVGSIRNAVKDVKEELDEVDEIVKKELGNGHHDMNEGGFIRPGWVANIAVLLVVGLTAWAAIVSQKASNDVQDANDQLKSAQVQLEHQTQCNRTVLRSALIALNERTTYSTAQVDANLALQTSFSDLLGILLHQPPYSERKRARATTSYYQDLTNFVSIADKTKRKQEENPYPDSAELDACLDAISTEGSSK